MSVCCGVVEALSYPRERDQPLPPVELVGSTGDPVIDDIVRKIVGVFETAFPGRIASY